MAADPFLRQRIVPGIGDDGQDALGSARIAIVGLGGLGAPAARYLAAAGVGHLTLVDADVVQTSNLARQILYTPADVGRPKVAAAAGALHEAAPWCTVVPLAQRLRDPGDELLAGHDIVLDGTDNWLSRRDVANAAARVSLPLVWGAVQGWYGQVTVFHTRVGLEDVFPERGPEPLDSCEGQGAVGITCGLVGVAMAGQALAAILGHPTIEGTLSHVDGRTGRWREVPLRARTRSHA